MFSELPSLLERDFVIGFFLPAFLLVVAEYGIILDFHLLTAVTDVIKNDPAQGITFLGLISIIASIILLTLNRTFYELLEGHNKYHPSRLFMWLEEYWYDRLERRINKLAINENTPYQVTNQKIQLVVWKSRRFPSEKEYLASTAFGNIIRAFELYPAIVYGVDNIYGWFRLLGVIPNDYRDLVDHSKASTDFWINVRFLSGLVILEYFLLALITAVTTLQWHWSWIVVVAILVMWFAANRAKTAAVAWGDLVKSCYDLYLPELGKQLGYVLPEDLENQYRFWFEISRTFIYGKKVYLENLDKRGYFKKPKD